MPSIEESIKNAMKELGIIDDAGNPLPQNTAAPKPDAVDPAPEPKPAPAPAPKAPPVRKTKAAEKAPKPVEPTPKAAEPSNEETQEDDIENIFCKIKNGQMALIFPVDLKTEQKVIGGTLVNVLNVALPDWTSTQLQALKIEQEEALTKTAAPAAVERTPIKAGKKSTAAPKPTQKATPVTNLGDESLDSLLTQKQELTAQIAEARAAGDTQLVNELRRKRRLVRGQIHKLGG